MTLNEAKELFSNIATAHKQINDFHFGFVWTIEEKMNNDCLYPMLVVVPMQSVTGEQVKDRTFQVMVMDVPKKDKSNLTEVWSDTEQILDDVIKIIRFETDTYELLGEPTLFPYDEDSTDWVSGYRAELTIRTNFNNNYCDIPSDTFRSPDQPNPVYVTIKDQNGNTIATVYGGGQYVVTVLSELNDTITANVTTITEEL